MTPRDLSMDARDPAENERTIGLLDRILEELRAGRTPEPENLAREFPESPDEIREMIAVVRLVHQATDKVDPSESLDVRVAHAKRKPVLDDFRIEREIGRGGMGVVYEATQLSLNRRVALKVLQPGVSISRHALARFSREALTAGSLHHTHIVPVYAVGQADGVHYYAMQFIEGRSLSAFIRQLRESRTPLDETYFRRVARWGVQMADALDHAHERGVIHRDIKPANIMRDKDDNIWLTDFGLARHETHDGLTQTEDLIGTARYMAPEQARGGRAPADERTDIFSLGVTLYELLTLTPPFDGADRESILRSVLQDEPRPLRKLTPGVPRGLETIVLKAIEKAPERRYVCAALLGEDLRRFLDGEPPLAQPPTSFQQLGRLFERNRGLFIGMATVIAVLAVFCGALAGLVTQRNAHLRRALDAERQARDDARAARQVSAYLQRLFRSFDPTLAGEGVLVGDMLAPDEMLERSAASAERDFADQPLTQAAILRTLGGVYRNRGRYARAAELLERGLGLRRSVSSEVDPELVAYLADLAGAKAPIDAAAEVEALWSEAIAMRKRLGGEQDPTVADLLRSLGQFQTNSGRAEEAERNLREALSLDEMATPNEARAAADRQALAGLLRMQERYDEAQQLLNDALSACERAFGSGSAQVANVYLNLGALHQATGAHEEAERCLAQARAIQEEVAGPEAYAVTLVMERQAGLAQARGNFAEASALYRAALEREKAALGPRHSSVSSTLAALARSLAAGGELDAAIERYRESAAIAAHCYGETGDMTLTALSNLSRALKDAGRIAEAIEVQQRVVAAAEPTRQAAPKRYAYALARLADLFDVADRTEEADATYKRAIELYRALDPELPELTTALVLHGRVVRWLGRLDEAEALFNEGLARLRSSRRADPIWTGNTLIDLCWTHSLKGDHAAAISAGQEGLSVVRREAPGDPVALGKALVCQAMALLGAARSEEAEPLLREAVGLRREKLGVEHWMTGSAESLLGDCLMRRGAYAEAEGLLTHALAVQEARLGVGHRFSAETRGRLERLRDAHGRLEE